MADFGSKVERRNPQGYIQNGRMTAKIPNALIQNYRIGIVKFVVNDLGSKDQQIQIQNGRLT